MGNNTTILLCDDDILVHQTMKLYFDQEGYTTISVYNGEDALIQLDMQPISLILLDIMLPGSSGTDICRKIRSKSEVPIIFLSAKGEEIDRVVGFELGADDYITKPFFPREVIARVKTVLKRFRPQKDPRTYELGKVKVNLLSYDVSVDGSPVKMTPKEGLSIAWALAQMQKAMMDGKSDVECMTILKEAYEDAMVLLGFSIYFDEKE